MRVRLFCCVVFWLSLSFFLSSASPDAYAQQGRRRRPSRRVTNPVAARPTPPADSSSTAPDARIISTAEEQNSSGTNDPNNSEVGGSRTANGARGGAARSETGNGTEGESLQSTVNRLSSQVSGLTNDLNQLKEQQRTLINLERLTRAEQRAESLRAQLRDVMKQEADTQARAEQLEYELQPEAIERRAATSGSSRPEEVRAQLQRQLQAERERVRTQLETFTLGRQRLETAVANADTETERLRQLIDRDTNDAAQTNRNDANPNASSTTNTTSPARTTTSPEGAPPVAAPPFQF